MYNCPYGVEINLLLDNEGLFKSNSLVKTVITLRYWVLI